MENQGSPDILAPVNTMDLSVGLTPIAGKNTASSSTGSVELVKHSELELDVTKARAAAFVTSCFNRFVNSSYNIPYRHAVLLGKEWYTLFSVTVIRKPRLELNLRFSGITSVLVFSGTKDTITRKLTDLLFFGFCYDCGEQGSATHRCKSLDVDVLNPPGDKRCSICQEDCNMATRMSCGHAFHFSCLSTFYDDNFVAKCPNCRKRVKRSMWDSNFRVTFSPGIDDSEAETEDDESNQ